jgi:protein-S-isoprenylcysteine O-methyltransferase Ste14
VAEVGLVLWALYGALAFVVPIALQLRRTGTTGLRGLSGWPGSIEWFAGVGLVVAIALGVAAAALAASGDVEPADALDVSALRAAGIVLYSLGLATVVFSQQWMSGSWRIGVDESERTQLVTSGPFRLVRNPIFTGMIVTSAGLALMVPSVLSLVSVLLLIGSLEVQTRLVEEPYLTRTHGDAYTGWASHAGRFLPGVGRLG